MANNCRIVWNSIYTINTPEVDKEFYCYDEEDLKEHGHEVPPDLLEQYLKNKAEFDRIQVQLAKIYKDAEKKRYG